MVAGGAICSVIGGPGKIQSLPIGYTNIRVVEVPLESPSAAAFEFYNHEQSETIFLTIAL